mgnify:CR=1 FL=1
MGLCSAIRRVFLNLSEGSFSVNFLLTVVLQAFLTNKKPKVLKDDNGREWLCVITTPPTISYDNNYGRGAITVDAGWTEIGDANSEDDLQNAGLIPKEG